MVQLNPIQTRSPVRKSSNTQVISVVCECMLKVVNGNLPVSIPNLKNFEETHKVLINPKMGLEKKSAAILSKQGLYLNGNIFCFCFKYLTA